MWRKNDLGEKDCFGLKLIWVKKKEKGAGLIYKLKELFI